MPVYQGGKARIGRRIHRVIRTVEDSLYDQEDVQKRTYYEPFIGMAGVMHHFGNENNTKSKSSLRRPLVASDINKDLVCMWKSLQKGWKPPLKCTRAKYTTLKHEHEGKIHTDKRKCNPERAYIGIVASWSGIYFHAYRLDYAGPGKDFMKEGYTSLMKIVPDMKHVKFLRPASYLTYDPGYGNTVYADPPYDGNALGQSGTLFQSFNHVEFWNEMRAWSKNNLVFISEWKAPNDFRKIWSAESSISPGKGRRAKKYSDNLYVHIDTYKQIPLYVKKQLKTM